MYVVGAQRREKPARVRRHRENTSLAGLWFETTQQYDSSPLATNPRNLLPSRTARRSTAHPLLLVLLTCSALLYQAWVGGECCPRGDPAEQRARLQVRGVRGLHHGQEDHQAAQRRRLRAARPRPNGRPTVSLSGNIFSFFGWDCGRRWVRQLNRGAFPLHTYCRRLLPVAVYLFYVRTRSQSPIFLFLGSTRV